MTLKVVTVARRVSSGKLDKREQCNNTETEKEEKWKKNEIW